MTKILNRITIFIAVFVLEACIIDPSRYGKVRQYNLADKKSFVFSVDEEYLLKNAKSPKDEQFQLMTEAEVKLIKALLMQNNYCIIDGSPYFKINSRQEKIYDMTFAHLIEQSYNAKPAAPRMYFGECL